MLDMIYFMLNDVVAALQLSLEDLGRNGLVLVPGKKSAMVVHCVL